MIPSEPRSSADFDFAPGTLNTLTLSEAKSRLSNAAITAIGAAKYELEDRSGVKLDLKDFEVEFIAWDEHAKFKMFAVYKNDQLDFPDKPLE